MIDECRIFSICAYGVEVIEDSGTVGILAWLCDSIHYAVFIVDVECTLETAVLDFVLVARGTCGDGILVSIDFPPEWQ